MRTLLLLGILLYGSSYSQGQKLTRYYEEISKKDFGQYDSAKLVSNIKNFFVYDVINISFNNRFKINDHVLILEKKQGKKSKFYKLDTEAKLKNDSVLIFFSHPFLVVGGKDTWEEGIWFYADFYKEKGSSGTKFKLDTIPENNQELIKNSKSNGIYRLEGKTLTKLTDEQSENAFYKIRLDGLYYIPNPGKFYLEARLDEIK